MYSWSENITSRGIALTCIWYRENFGLCTSVLYSAVQVSLEIVGAVFSVFEILGCALFQISTCSLYSGAIVLQDVTDQLSKSILIILLSPLLLLFSIGQALYDGPKTVPLFSLAEKHFWVLNSLSIKVASS